MNLHRAWFADTSIDAAFAPTEETYAEAIAAGFAPDRVKLVGWPVRRQFYEQRTGDRPAFLHTLGLRPDCFTIFLQGGGEGAARFARTVEALLALNQEQAPSRGDASRFGPRRGIPYRPRRDGRTASQHGAQDGAEPRVQIILAVGTNELLKQRFINRPHVYVLPFTRQIAPYMDAADIVMGKAGPNMLFESVTLGKPFVATTYIPGQEEPNLEFITRHGLGWVALEAEDQRALVRSLTENPEQQAAMRASVERRRAQNSEQNATILPITRALIERVRQEK